MGRFAESGTNSEDFQNTMDYEAGRVECKVCKVKFGQGNKGMSICVCIACYEYFCNDHIERHPLCEEGR